MVSKYKQQDLEVRAVGEEGQKLEMRLKNDAAIMSDNERSKLASDLEAKIQEYKYLKSKLDKALAEKRQAFLTDSKPKIDQAINELVNCKRGASIEMAFKLSKAFDTSPEFWINLQKKYDIYYKISYFMYLD